MPKRLLAAVATMSLLFVSPGSATDMYGGYDSEEPRAEEGSPYDDPRYADMYRRPQPESYESEAPPPRPYDRYGDGYREPRVAAPWRPCMSRPELWRHARMQGWDVLRWQDFTPSTATFVAERRADGRTFDVTVDRCSAQILAVSPIRARYDDGARYDDYAWRRRIYDRPY